MDQYGSIRKGLYVMTVKQLLDIINSLPCNENDKISIEAFNDSGFTDYLTLERDSIGYDKVTKTLHIDTRIYS